MADAPETDSHESEPLSPKTKEILALIQALLPVMTAIIGGLWVAYTYLEQQNEARAQQEIQSKRDNETRLLEARKPFLDKQLTLYGEAAEVTGKLVAIYPPVFDDWKKNEQIFEELFWTELSVVEDQEVKHAMQEFSQQLKIVDSDWIGQLYRRSDAEQKDFEELRQRSYRLALALRDSIQASWNVELNGSTNR